MKVLWDDVVREFDSFNINPLDKSYIGNFENFRIKSEFNFEEFMKNLTDSTIEDFANDKKVTYFQILNEILNFFTHYEKIENNKKINRNLEKIRCLSSYKFFINHFGKRYDLNLSNFYFSIFEENLFDKMSNKYQRKFSESSDKGNNEESNFLNFYKEKNLIENLTKVINFSENISNIFSVHPISYFQNENLFGTSSLVKKKKTFDSRKSFMKKGTNQSSVFEENNNTPKLSMSTTESKITMRNLKKEYEENKRFSSFNPKKKNNKK